MIAFLSHSVEEWQATVTAGSQWSTGNISDCSARDPGIDSHREWYVCPKTIAIDSLRHGMHFFYPCTIINS